MWRSPGTAPSRLSWTWHCRLWCATAAWRSTGTGWCTPACSPCSSGCCSSTPMTCACTASLRRPWLTSPWSPTYTRCSSARVGWASWPAGCATPRPCCRSQPAELWPTWTPTLRGRWATATAFTSCIPSTGLVPWNPWQTWSWCMACWAVSSRPGDSTTARRARATTPWSLTSWLCAVASTASLRTA
uniref:Secreted protein n=1 Tax=Ixodes ricinus TaxID=34613 RepID=A0A147BQK6_IXORI